MNLEPFYRLDKQIKTAFISKYEKIEIEKVFSGLLWGFGLTMICISLIVYFIAPNQTNMILTLLMLGGGISLMRMIK